jgi:uncharacterized iron-regulated protein
MLVAAASSAAAGGPPPRYDLTVMVDTEKALLRGTARIALPEGVETHVHMHDLRVISVSPAGSVKVRGNGNVLDISGTVEILYEGSFKMSAKKTPSAESVGIVPSVISPEGISLTVGWYPQLEGPAYYTLSALLPDGLTAVSEADDVTTRRVEDGMVEHSFLFPWPLPGVSLVAGRYEERKETFQGTDIYMYFFPGDASLADIYMEHTKGYLKDYEEMLGPYPHMRFSVVENFLESGYSMPTFTLLGRTVLRLPFIPETSLGHEVLHQWFGNYVYVDYATGNWVEGLTSYLSDHLFAQRKGEGPKYRKKSLMDYQSYVTPGKAFELWKFTQRADFASRAVGYGKGLMLFHMLRSVVGEEAFLAALREFLRENRFRKAGWKDIRAAFEGAHGEDLGWFFDQWLRRKDVISFKINSARVRYLDAVPTVTLDIEQKGDPYRFGLPVRVVTEEGETRTVLEVAKKKKHFEIAVEGTPLKMLIDEDYSVMRRLWDEELPPAISRLLGDEKRTVVTPEEGGGKYEALVSALKRMGFEIKPEGELKDEDVRHSSLLILGTGGPTLRRLFAAETLPGLSPGPGGFSIAVLDNPINPSHVVAVAYAEDKEEAAAAARKIFRYGKYSRLSFSGGSNTLKETADSERGILFDFERPVRGVRPREALSLGEIIMEILKKDIIYVGEGHKNFEDHRVQLEVIRALQKAGRKFAIGMEMFQQPSQKALDDYIQAETGEKEFLKASKYFKQWGMDYNLYREILGFARARGIKVAALNLRRKIIAKVSKGGLDALSEEEKKEIPSDMDMSDTAYRERLREIYRLHPERRRSKKFEHFYQSQILWDESMAHAIDAFLTENPGFQMVVIAGQGHIAYGSGIPRRAHRLNGRDYVTLINSKVLTLDEDLADYVIFSPPLPLPAAPMLMVRLEEKKGKVRITGFQKKSVSEKAGLREGDVFLSIDGTVVKSVQDVRIQLYDRRTGDTLKIKVLRERFLLGEEELEFDVTL